MGTIDASARFLLEHLAGPRLQAAIEERQVHGDGGKVLRIAALSVFARLALPVLLLSFGSNGLAQQSIISTYAGPRLPTDGALAIRSAFDSPCSVASDGMGGFYFADTLQNRVYRVTSDGTVHLAAGSTLGFGGDGGPATSAQLNSPQGVAVDGAGSLYIADTGNHRVRKVTTAGIISTVAGNGKAGRLAEGGPATAAQLEFPVAVAVDAAGNLFIADGQVWKVTTAGIISTVAGNGTSGYAGDGGAATAAELNLPVGVALDARGDLYIAEYLNNRVRKVTPDGVIETIAGNGTMGFSGDGGPATRAELNCPSGVAVDAAGNVYIADAANHRIRKVTPDGVISTIAGTGVAGFSGDGRPATLAQLIDPLGVAVDPQGNIYIADNVYCGRIRKVDSNGMISTVAGEGILGYSGDGGPATAAQLNGPQGVAIDASGDVYIADTDNHRIREVTPAGEIITVAGDGNFGYSGDGGRATTAQLWGPTGVTVDAEGDLYIADTYNNRIRKVTPDGVITTVAGNGTLGYGGDGGPATSAQLNLPSKVAVDSQGNIYIADTYNNRIRKVTPEGMITTVAGNGAFGYSGDIGPAILARLAFPSGIAVDASGNLYIADTDNDRIRRVSPDGFIGTVAGGNGVWESSGDGGPATLAQVIYPNGLSLDKIGNLYVAQFDSRIRKITPDGMISTVAGNGVSGYSGDGGPSTSAQVNMPLNVAVDDVGNLYVADWGNSRIRKVTFLRESLGLTLSSGGATSATTMASNGPVQTGYAVVHSSNGNAPYGTAIFSLIQNGRVVSEAGVPASPPTTHASLFVEFQSSSALESDGNPEENFSVNTGVAVVNREPEAAHLAFTLRDESGNEFTVGHGTLAANGHFATFIDTLNQVVAGFNLPWNYGSKARLGTLEIESDQPVSILALRITVNRRGETLMTTTPIADLTKPPSNDSLYFPQLADGGGWQTTLMLINNSSIVETGRLLIREDDGSPLTVRQLGGSPGAAFAYSVPPHRSVCLQD